MSCPIRFVIGSLRRLFPVYEDLSQYNALLQSKLTGRIELVEKVKYNCGSNKMFNNYHLNCLGLLIYLQVHYEIENTFYS